MRKIVLVCTLLTLQNSFAKVYTIKPNKHYAQGIHAAPFICNKIDRTVKFNESAEYYLGNVNQYDINKLFGFSDCLSHHHTNSVRFGWLWNDQKLKLEIYAYGYANKKRTFKFISDVEINQSYDYSIEVKETEYVLKVNGKSASLPRACKMKNAIGYQLYPYFGGDEVSPQEIKIEINKK